MARWRFLKVCSVACRLAIAVSRRGVWADCLAKWLEVVVNLFIRSLRAIRPRTSIKHPAPYLFLSVVLVALAVPWTISSRSGGFLLRADGIWRGRKPLDTPARVYLLWIAVPVVFFLFGIKKTAYILPAFACG